MSFGIQSHVSLYGKTWQNMAKQRKTWADTLPCPKRQRLHTKNFMTLTLSALSSVVSLQQTAHYIWDLKKTQAAKTGFRHQLVTANFNCNLSAATQVI